MAAEKTELLGTDIILKRSVGSTLWDKITGSNLIVSIRNYINGYNEKPHGFGYLYNWYAASDARGFHSDWHVPTSTEFQTLSDYLGGNTVSGGKLKSLKLQPDKYGWLIDNIGSINTSEFNAIPGGSRFSTSFDFLHYFARFWSTTLSTVSTSKYLNLSYTSTIASISTTNNIVGFSIRLIRNNDTGWYKGQRVLIDGKYYDTVKIGTQIWLAQNLAATHYANGDTIPNVTDDTAWANLTTHAYCAYNNDETLVWTPEDDKVTDAEKALWNGKQAALTFSEDIEADKLSITKISAIKTFYDWAIGKFSLIGHNHSGVYQPAGTYSTDIHTNISALDSVSGVNTGDNATNSQYSGLEASKQETLVSGTNIKTINNNSLLGSGNIVITGGGDFLTMQIFS